MSRSNIQRFGSGSVKVVAIHGLGSAATAWKTLIPLLPNSIEFISIDLPGHGKSSVLASRDMSPEYLAHFILDELEDQGLIDLHVIGNSLGGWIGLEMAAMAPTRIKSVTAVAPAGFWMHPAVKRDPYLLSSRFLASLTYRFAKFLSKFKFMRWLGFRLVSPQWEKFTPEICADAAIAMGASKGYFQIWDALLGLKFNKKVKESIPVTIIFGDSDNTLPASTSQEKKLAPAHSRWVRLEKSGHAPMWDQSEKVMRLLLETIELAEK